MIARASSRAAVLLPLLLAVSACGAEGGGAAAREVITRDSAGVAIIEYGEEAWRDAPIWRLDSVALVAIGTVDGPPEYELEYVADAVRLDDGTIAIADGRASAIKFYDGRGKFVRSVGREGKGPGEYESILFFSRYGADSLLVWDASLGRGSLLANDGDFGRVISTPPVTRGVSVLGVFGDGWVLGTAAGVVPSDLPMGASRRSTEFFRFSLPGQVDTIARLFVGEFFKTAGGVFGDLSFGPTAIATAADEYMYYTPSESYQVLTYTEAGSLARIVRFARESPLTPEDIDQAIEERRANFPANVQYMFAGIPHPKSMPMYQKMEVATDGTLWVGDYLLHPNDEPRGWTILGPDGALLGRLLAPPHFTIYDIGDDWLLGGMPGEMDVPRVLLYRLIKPA